MEGVYYTRDELNRERRIAALPPWHQIPRQVIPSLGFEWGVETHIVGSHIECDCGSLEFDPYGSDLGRNPGAASHTTLGQDGTDHPMAQHENVVHE